MRKLFLYERKTFKYAGGHADMDEHNFVGKVALTKPVITTKGGSFYPTITKSVCRVPANLDVHKVAQGLKDTIGGTDCKHTHDCCGCSYRMVFTRLIKPRQLSVVVVSTLNY